MKCAIANVESTMKTGIAALLAAFIMVPAFSQTSANVVILADRLLDVRAGRAGSTLMCRKYFSQRCRIFQETS